MVMNGTSCCSVGSEFLPKSRALQFVWHNEFTVYAAKSRRADMGKYEISMCHALHNILSWTLFVYILCNQHKEAIDFFYHLRAYTWCTHRAPCWSENSHRRAMQSIVSVANQQHPEHSTRHLLAMEDKSCPPGMLASKITTPSLMLNAGKRQCWHRCPEHSASLKLPAQADLEHADAWQCMSFSACITRGLLPYMHLLADPIAEQYCVFSIDTARHA